MADLRGLHHVAISVRDLDRSLRFYGEVLGLQPAGRGTMHGEGITRLVGAPRGQMARQAFLRGEGSLGQVELVQWTPAAQGGARRITDLGLSLISFAVSPAGFESILERCRASGAEILGGPEVLDVADYPPTRLVIVADPDGNAVEFMAPASPEQVAGARAGAA